MDPTTLRLMSVGQSVLSATYVQATSVSTNNSGNNIILDKPTSTQSGDLLVALIRSGGGDDTSYTSTPSGWTNVYTSGSGNGRTYVGYKVAGGSEPSTYTFGTGNSASKSGIMLLFRNAAWDTAGRNVGSTSAPSITVASNGSILVAFFSEDGSATYSSPSSGLVYINGESSGNSGSFAVYYDDDYPAGSSGTKTVTFSTNSSPSCSILISIKPA